MGKISLTAVLVVSVLVFFQPHPIQALPAILPDCDQTLYLTLNPAGGGTCDPKTFAGCFPDTPQEYDKRYPSQDDKEKHPPTIVTNRACGFNDFVQLFINLSSWGLAILAGLGVLIFVWGGFTLLTALGNQEKIREGKMTVWGSVLGITIVLTSWVFINFFVSALTGTGPTLFFGTRYAREFSGTAPCPADYNTKCTEQALRLKCTDRAGNNYGVSRVQRILSDIRCYNDRVDGCFGPITNDALRRFQEANAKCYIETPIGTRITMHDAPTGEVDATTWAFLDAVYTGVRITCDSTQSPVKTCL